MTRRVVAWFSHGACSAIACKLTLAKYGPDVILANIDTGAEHSDNERFRIDCEKWYQHPITVLKSEQFTDTWDVWEKTRYLVGPSGARCTGELKKKVRYRFELPDDLNIFGYAADKNDAARALVGNLRSVGGLFQTTNPEVERIVMLVRQKASLSK